jgi:hypothetical protein
MWEPRRLTTLWASTACYRDSFTLPYLTLPYNRITPTSNKMELVRQFCADAQYQIDLKSVHRFQSYNTLWDREARGKSRPPLYVTPLPFSYKQNKRINVILTESQIQTPSFTKYAFYSSTLNRQILNWIQCLIFTAPHVLHVFSLGVNILIFRKELSKCIQIFCRKETKEL